jgi:hypothetical protein
MAQLPKLGAIIALFNSYNFCLLCTIIINNVVLFTHGIYRLDQQENGYRFFYEFDQLQRLPIGPILEDIWIPNNLADNQAYLKREIALPRTAEDDHTGNINAELIFNYLTIIHF